MRKLLQIARVLLKQRNLATQMSYHPSRSEKNESFHVDDRLMLAVESSCDDTSAAVLRGNRVLSNVTAGQQVHEEYGGVVPELASRAHQSHILPVVLSALKRADANKHDLEAIAYTRGPGLLGSLLVGASFAKSLALSLRVPLVEVHHMRAHILAHFIDDDRQRIPALPFLCLTVSGGHTQLVVVKSPLDMEVIGQTRDDAAGEAFDKIAKIMGMPYPGGPLIDQYARSGNPEAFTFGKPRLDGLDFSFSGLKTSVLYTLQKAVREHPAFVEEHRDDLAASVQATIIDILMDKLVQAAEQTGIRHIALAGGVSANSGLRQELRMAGAANDWEVYIPDFSYCTDNAAMIGMAGQLQLAVGMTSGLGNAPDARWPFAMG